MIVITTTPAPGNGHRIEFGRSTWNLDEWSVRNRYPTRNGGFSPRSSSEIPLRDIQLIVAALAEQDRIEPQALVAMIEVLAASLARTMPGQ
jgi:hypothetical protein